MLANHMTSAEINRYLEHELDQNRCAEMDTHLTACPACRARVERAARLDRALRALPRTQPPSELAARIGATIEARVKQEQARRARVPVIAVATFFSILLALWFCFELNLAFQMSGVSDFWAMFISYSDVLSTDSLDALLAVLEALPLSEIVLTSCALLTVGVLAQQLIESLRPRALQFK